MGHGDTRDSWSAAGGASGLVLLAALAACAGTPPQDARSRQQRVAAAAQAEAAGETSPVLCEDVQEVGSRMTKRLCRTAAEIAAERESAKAKLAEYRRIGRVRGAKW